jgi:transketolase
VRTYLLEIKYEFLKALRMPQYSLPTILFPIVFYVFFGVVFGQRNTGGIRMAEYLIATYGAFAAMRTTDMIRISMCYNDANVKIGGGHAGISVGPDGATHQALEEIAVLRVMPNMTLVVPCDYNEARKATVAIGEHVGPCYIRFGRVDTPTFTKEDTPFVLGKAQTFRDGYDVAIMACGPMVWEALEAAKGLLHSGT